MVIGALCYTVASSDKERQEFRIFRSVERGFGRDPLKRGPFVWEQGCKVPEGSFIIASFPHKNFPYSEV